MMGPRLKLAAALLCALLLVNGQWLSQVQARASEEFSSAQLPPLVPSESGEEPSTAVESVKQSAAAESEKIKPEETSKEAASAESAPAPETGDKKPKTDEPLLSYEPSAPTSAAAVAEAKRAEDEAAKRAADFRAAGVAPDQQQQVAAAPANEETLAKSRTELKSLLENKNDAENDLASAPAVKPSQSALPAASNPTSGDEAKPATTGAEEVSVSGLAGQKPSDDRFHYSLGGVASAEREKPTSVAPATNPTEKAKHEEEVEDELEGDGSKRDEDEESGKGYDTTTTTALTPAAKPTEPIAVKEAGPAQASTSPAPATTGESKADERASAPDTGKAEPQADMNVKSSTEVKSTHSSGAETLASDEVSSTKAPEKAKEAPQSSEKPDAPLTTTTMTVTSSSSATTTTEQPKQGDFSDKADSNKDLSHNATESTVTAPTNKTVIKADDNRFPIDALAAGTISALGTALAKDKDKTKSTTTTTTTTQSPVSSSPGTSRAPASSSTTRRSSVVNRWNNWTPSSPAPVSSSMPPTRRRPILPSLRRRFRPSYSGFPWALPEPYSPFDASSGDGVEPNFGFGAPSSTAAGSNRRRTTSGPASGASKPPKPIPSSNGGSSAPSPSSTGNNGSSPHELGSDGDENPTGGSRSGLGPTTHTRRRHQNHHNRHHHRHSSPPNEETPEFGGPHDSHRHNHHRRNHHNHHRHSPNRPGSDARGPGHRSQKPPTDERITPGFLGNAGGSVGLEPSSAGPRPGGFGLFNSAGAGTGQPTGPLSGFDLLNPFSWLDEVVRPRPPPFQRSPQAGVPSYAGTPGRRFSSRPEAFEGEYGSAGSSGEPSRPSDSIAPAGPKPPGHNYNRPAHRHDSSDEAVHHNEHGLSHAHHGRPHGRPFGSGGVGGRPERDDYDEYHECYYHGRCRGNGHNNDYDYDHDHRPHRPPYRPTSGREPPFSGSRPGHGDYDRPQYGRRPGPDEERPYSWRSENGGESRRELESETASSGSSGRSPSPSSSSTGSSRSGLNSEMGPSQPSAERIENEQSTSSSSTSGGQSSPSGPRRVPASMFSPFDTLFGSLDDDLFGGLRSSFIDSPMKAASDSVRRANNAAFEAIISSPKISLPVASDNKPAAVSSSGQRPFEAAAEAGGSEGEPCDDEQGGSSSRTVLAKVQSGDVQPLNGATDRRSRAALRLY